MAKRRVDKPPLDSIGEHLTNQLGSLKKSTTRKFRRALLKSLCQSFHRPLAFRSRTLLTFAQADVVRIHGIGKSLRGLLACRQNSESVERVCRNVAEGFG